MCLVSSEGFEWCHGNTKIYTLPATKTCAAASEIQQTEFQQRQAI